jgi:hypothetical protein
VSRAYFNQLSAKELSHYNVDEAKPAGWFIRLIDVDEPIDPSPRSFLMYSLLQLCIEGGVFIASTPLPFYQEMLIRFGFQKIKGITHYDFGTSSPSYYYILDIRENRLLSYLDQLATKIYPKPILMNQQDSYSFSRREFPAENWKLRSY